MELMMNKLKDVYNKVTDVVENVILSLRTYEDIVVKFITKNPRTTVWIWLGTIYLTWRVS